MRIDFVPLHSIHILATFLSVSFVLAVKTLLNKSFFPAPAAVLSPQTTSSPDPDIPKLFNTQSTLKLLGSPRLHKSVVQCRASVSTLPQHSATAKVTLRVMGELTSTYSRGHACNVPSVNVFRFIYLFIYFIY